MATAAGLTRNSIWRVLNGHDPKSSRLARICEACGLEFYVGPPRDERPELPPDSESHAWADRRGKEVTPYPVQMREGHAPERVGFSPHGCAHYGLDFLLNHDLNPKLCEVVEISDDSMAPEFPAGAAGLVDLRRTELVAGRVCAISMPELTVRRLSATSGSWRMEADNPKFEPIPWFDEFRVVGEIVWTSHMVGLRTYVGSGTAGLAARARHDQS